MDPWGWDQLAPWGEQRLELPVGALLRIITGPTAGRPWSAAGARRPLGHPNLGITSVDLQGIDSAEITGTVYARRAPMLPASADLVRPR